MLSTNRRRIRKELNMKERTSVEVIPGEGFCMGTSQNRQKWGGEEGGGGAQRLEPWSRFWSGVVTLEECYPYSAHSFLCVSPRRLPYKPEAWASCGHWQETEQRKAWSEYLLQLLPSSQACSCFFTYHFWPRVLVTLPASPRAKGEVKEWIVILCGFATLFPHFHKQSLIQFFSNYSD